MPPSKYTKLPAVDSRDFWLQLNPELHISDRPFRSSQSRYKVNAPDMAGPIRQIVREGYCQLPPVIPREETTRLAATVKRIHNLGLPPVFAFVYDEFWQVFANLSEVIGQVIGANYRIQPDDFWIWHVDPGNAGFPPHRDHHRMLTPQPDGRPAFMSVWVPLVDVTPMNGCLYVVPTNRDPNLPFRWTRRIFGPRISLKDLQSVRALPASAGSVLCWIPHILHWGARCSEWSDQPRISVAVYLQCNEYRDADENYAWSKDSISLNADTALTFGARLEGIRTAIRGLPMRVASEYTAVADELSVFAGENQLPRSRWEFLRTLMIWK